MGALVLRGGGERDCRVGLVGGGGARKVCRDSLEYSCKFCNTVVCFMV